MTGSVLEAFSLVSSWRHKCKCLWSSTPTLASPRAISKVSGCSAVCFGSCPVAHGLESPGLLPQIRAGAVPGAANKTNKAPGIRYSGVELRADRWNHMGKLIIFFFSFSWVFVSLQEPNLCINYTSELSEGAWATQTASALS